MRISFFIYDERYHTDPDRAICYEVCETLQEARENGPDYGGHVIVKVKSKKVAAGSWEVVSETLIE